MSEENNDDWFGALIVTAGVVAFITVVLTMHSCYTARLDHDAKFHQHDQEACYERLRND